MSRDYPIISNDLEIQNVYEDIRAQGTSHKLAEMLAMKRGPSLSTDTRFRADLSDDPFDGVPEQFKLAYAAKATKAGINPTGKHYNGLLARFPGDPEALVSDRSDIRRVAEKRGLGVECGPVKTKMREAPPDEEPYRVAPDIVEREVNRQIKEAGEKPTPTEHAELTAKTTDRLSGD